jgi:hypothetical protein
MAHDVFISYSHEDHTVANAAVAALESHGIRCFIAPRDILAGSDWGEAIIDAIEEARAMVLILSSHSNESDQIKREVERTVHQGIAVLPFRIEDIVPSKTLEYFISTQHWLDAMTPPLEDHLAHLADTLTVLLAKKGGKEKPLHIGGEEPGPAPKERQPEVMSPKDQPRVITVSIPPGKFSRILLFSLIGFLALVVLAGGIWWRWSQTKYTGMDFQKLNARVVGIKFFAQGQTPLPVKERVYREGFAPSPNSYIYWELDLAYANTSEPVTFTIESTWYGPKGNIINIFFTKHTIKAGWDNSQHSDGIEVNSLKEPGTYRVVLKIGGNEVASGSFQLLTAGLAAKVLFEDKFTTLDPSWGALPSALINAKDGKLIITPDKNLSQTYLNQANILPNDMEANYTVTFVKAAAPAYASGLVFWAKDFDNWYSFEINAVGFFHVLWHTRDRYLTPVAWREDASLKKGEGAENQVKVVTKGNQATIFINGKEVVSFTGQPPQGGSLIGFIVSSGPEGSNSVAFSNFQVVQP